MLSRRNKALLALLVLGGCATQPVMPVEQAAWAQTDGVKYKCAAGHTFIASFAPDASRAAIKIGETVYDVPQVESASGVHYQSDEIDFMGKGRDAQLLKSPNGQFEACRVVD